MKKYFTMFALLLGVCAANAQETDTVRYAAGNDLYQGITRKLPYRQMVTPYGVEVTFAKTVHIIFPSAVRYDRGLSGGNELLRYLRGRQFLFLQCQVCP